ncbi:MAG: aminotransferase class III-fold pyridoxal phosphate-dependent enzyme, partial [Planctomycetota bacterium]
TGFFTTGRTWAFQHMGVEPDIVAFGKKAQQCGIFCGPKIDRVPGNVFETSSRINSTWGGNLVDMARCIRVLEVVKAENLAANAARMGERWLAGMRGLAEARPDLVSNVRALGLLMAFDLPGGEFRARFLDTAFENGLMALACGSRTVRFRPHLSVSAEEIDGCLEILAATLKALPA